MPSPNRFILSIVSLSLLSLLIGCGSSSNKATPPPTGGFSNSSLNGTYVFSTSGMDVNGLPIMLTGAFSANGTGGVGGGAFTIADGSVGVFSNQTISGGTYSITQDGRGQVHLSNSVSGLGTVVLDFVLTATGHGFVTEFDGNGSGSGTLDLQGTTSGVAGQSYAFSLSGSDATGASPIATAGAFTLDSTGAVTTGVQDITTYNSSSGTSSTTAGIVLSNTSGVGVGTGTAAGTAQIGQFAFDVYAVDDTHLKVVENDGVDYMSGDVFTQASSLPTGIVAFSMAGADTTAGPLALGGLLPVSSGAISGGAEDYNDGGNVNTVTSVSGSFGTLTGGRSVLTLTNMENGATGQVLGTYQFAAYPSSGGTLLLEIDGLGISGGMALAQTQTSFAASQGYGVNLAASNSSGFAEDDIAEFSATSSAFSGLVDVNDQGTTNFDRTFDGTYQQPASGTGRYGFIANSSSGFAGFSGVFYTVDGSTVLFVETDSTQVGTGAFEVQSSTTSASSAKARPFHVSGLISKLAAKHSAKFRKHS